VKRRKAQAIRSRRPHGLAAVAGLKSRFDRLAGRLTGGPD